MSKNIILKLKGVIEVECIVSSSFTRTYRGNAQTSKSENIKDLFRRATLDCIYQHLRQGGKSSPRTQIINYKMNYLGEKDLIKIKRVNRGGKYYTYVSDRKTGKIITYQKWSPKQKLSVFN